MGGADELRSIIAKQDPKNQSRQSDVLFQRRGGTSSGSRRRIRNEQARLAEQIKIEERGLAARRVADSIREKEALKASALSSQQLQSDIKSRTVAGQLSSGGPTPSQIGLPPTGRSTFGKTGLGGALAETGKRALGRFVGRGEVGDVLSPLDTTVVPKAGRGAFQLGDRSFETRGFGLLKVAGAIGLSKVSDARFTTFGEIQKDIESGRQVKISPEQKRQQSRIDAGEISVEDASAEFKQFQQDVFKTSPDVPGIRGGRRSPLRTGVDIALSFNPLTAFAAGAASSQQDPITVDIGQIERGVSIAGASTQRPSARTAGFFGAGVLSAASRGFSQQAGGILSRQAVRESQIELSLKPFVPTKPGRVTGRGAGFQRIETTQARALDGGLTRQDVVSRVLVTEVSGGRVAVPGGKGVSRTQIFDPISGQIIKGTPEEFAIGTKFPLDVSSGGRAISRRGSRIDFSKELPDIVSVEGTAFIRPKSGSSFTEFETFGVGVKTKKGTGVLGFKEGDVLLSTEEALFKETGRRVFNREGRQVTRFTRGGTKVGRNERVFTETGDGLFGNVGDPLTTRSGAPIVRIERSGIRVRDASSFDFIPSSKTAPKLDDLFDIGIQPVKPIRRAKREPVDFTKTSGEGVFNLVDIKPLKTPKAPPIGREGTGAGGQVLLQIPKTQQTSFEQSSKVAASSLSRGFDFIKPTSVQGVGPTSLIGIPRAVGGGGLASLQFTSAQPRTQTVLIDRGLSSPLLKEDKATSIGLDIFQGTRLSKDTLSKSAFATATKSATKSAQASLSQSALKSASAKASRFSLATPSLFATDIAPSFSPRGFGFGFAAFALPKIPSLGGSGSPPKRSRDRKVKQRKIKPSFTAVALEIESKLPKTIGGFGINPFAIRGLSPSKKKKSKKKK